MMRDQEGMIDIERSVMPRQASEVRLDGSVGRER
jgi:hypothetical protein